MEVTPFDVARNKLLHAVDRETLRRRYLLEMAEYWFERPEVRQTRHEARKTNNLKEY